MSTAQPARVQSEILTDSRSRDRKFFTAYSFLGIAAVFIGFARTYYLRAYTEAPPLSTIVHLHAVIFSVWMVLFAVQTSLVAAKRVALHRSVGIGSVVLAVAMLILGFITAVVGARDGWMGPQQARDPVGGLSFLTVPLGDLVLFSAFFSMALYYRHKPETHKRLMILILCGAIMPAAFFRLPLPVAFTLLFSFLLAGPIYDRLSHGRIHSVYKWGVPLIIVSGFLRDMLGATEPWHRFARWLIEVTL
jgi:hypothetical protein